MKINASARTTIANIYSRCITTMDTRNLFIATVIPCVHSTSNEWNNFQCKTIAKISFSENENAVRARNFFKQSFELRGLDLFFYTYVIGTNKYIYMCVYVWCARVCVCVCMNTYLPMFMWTEVCKVSTKNKTNEM